MDEYTVTIKSLKQERADIWNGLLIHNGLDIRQYPWWTDEDKALEQKLWEQADRRYEGKRTELAKQG